MDVVVIGAGPAGLAAAATLGRAGIEALVLERAPAVAASWRQHYDRLHLHTARRWSGLPGLRIPRECGRWVSRDDVVAYLEAYVRHHRLRVQVDTAVQRLERGWKVHTSRGAMGADAVVVATGYNHTPYTPDWPGRFAGQLHHASRYRNAAPFRGQSVLVAGTGNSGAEIAVDLAEGGAKKVWLAARTPPNIVLRSLAGIPTQAFGIVFRQLPPRLADALTRVVQAVMVGDLTRYGLPHPPRGTYVRATVDKQIPILDVGLIDAVKRGAVEMVPGVEGFDGADVLLAGGKRLSPEVVIAATGYRRGLESLVGELGVLDASGEPLVHGAVTHPNAPGLYFIGYTNPISGNLRELGIDARRIARALSKTARRPELPQAAPLS